MSIIENSEQCDQLVVENLNQELISDPPLDPRLEIYLRLEGIYDYDSDCSEDYFDEETSTEEAMDYEYSNYPENQNINIPRNNNASKVNVGYSSQMQISATARPSNRPPPPSQDLYKSLINRSEHPIKPVQHSTGVYSYSEFQKPPQHEVMRTQLSSNVHGSSNRQNPPTMLQRSLDAMRHVTDVRPNSDLNPKGGHVSGGGKYQEYRVNPSNPQPKGPQSLNATFSKPQYTTTTTSYKPPSPTTREHLAPSTTHQGSSAPTMSHPTTHQRPPPSFSSPRQHALPSSTHNRPPPPTAGMFKAFLDQGPLPTNSQKHVQYSNIPLSHLQRKPNSQLPSNQTPSPSQFPSNQEPPSSQFPNNQTPAPFPSNQRPSPSHFPGNQAPPSSQFPSNQGPSPSHYPGNQAPPSSQFPSNQRPSPSHYPGNQAPPTSQLPSNQGPSPSQSSRSQVRSTSQFPGNQPPPSSHIPSNKIPPSSPLPNNQSPSLTQFPSNQKTTIPTTKTATGAQPSLESKIISFLQNQQRPCNTNSIRLSVGAATKKEINPVLYAMQRQGIITKVVESPPTWKLCPGKDASLAAKAPSQPSPEQSFGRGHQTPNISQIQTPTQPSSSSQTKPTKPTSGASSTTKEFFEACFTSINKNPVSALNNYAQKNKSEATFEIISQKTFGKPSFTVAAKLGDRMFTAVTASNMKEAKRQAADVALREIGQVPTGSDNSDGKLDLSNLPSIPRDSSWTHFDRMAALSHQLFARIAPTVSASFAGRKVIACMIMKMGEQDPGRVVSLGAGNRCITGMRISLEGKKVNDSHAEIIARRGLIRVFYKEISNCFAGKESLFKRKPNTTKLCLRDGVTFHLYISTAPCGDGALFSPREAGSVESTGGVLTREHNPTFTGKQQGILRTKIEDGEGTLPIDFNAPPQTWDGLLQGERLRTMSCSDKICRWNVLGLQGALLSHFVEPIYLESLTLGYLYDHGHLSRAVCCRLQHHSNLNDRISGGYHVNHPCIGRVTAYDPPRETEKTNNISINWALGDTYAEVTDGRDGACLTRTGNAPTPSRLCKAALYGNFRALCRRVPNFQHLLNADSYKEAKSSAEDFTRTKQEMKTQFKTSKYSQWVSKPMEQDLFNESLPALDVLLS